MTTAPAAPAAAIRFFAAEPPRPMPGRPGDLRAAPVRRALDLSTARAARSGKQNLACAVLAALAR